MSDAAVRFAGLFRDGGCLHKRVTHRSDLAEARELVQLARAVVTRLGPTPVAWQIAEAAAALERRIFVLEG